MIISLAYCAGLIWTVTRSTKFGYSRETALDICLVIMVSGFLGARLMHVFYESPQYYADDPLAALKIWQGGFVFFGGMLGAWLGTHLFLRYRGENFWKWADFFAPILALGYAIGRLGCFFNGCCYGKVCDLPWAVEFTAPGTVLGHRHPAPLYATIFEFAVVALLLAVSRGKIKSGPLSKSFAWLDIQGNIFAAWLILHGFGRVIMEHFRDDFRGSEILSLSISTWIAAALITAGVVRIILSKRQQIAVKNNS